MDEFNKEIALRTLKTVLDILKKHQVEYRFIGSVLAAAVNGKLHRNLGDIDLIIDENKKDKVYDALNKIGYSPVGGMYEFARRYLCLETMRCPSYLEVGFFYGRWQRDGSIIMGNKATRVSVDAEALIPTSYSLYGLSFIGINPRAAATRIRASNANPKRKKELEFFAKKQIEPLADSFVHVAIFGFNFDWTYYLFSSLQNFVGKLRIAVGLPFDPWR